jgi:kinesin family protein 2/24
VGSESEMISMIEFAHSERTTHATTSNDTSSRSHAICSIQIKEGSGKLMGKLLLVDLAGSERA